MRKQPLKLMKQEHLLWGIAHEPVWPVVQQPLDCLCLASYCFLRQRAATLKLKLVKRNLIQYCQYAINKVGMKQTEHRNLVPP
mmetsp:Transcript_8235/g.30952  ORF Transcript_8235/g.30952 Transcript_8235/m.30952 type:complete len:83 (+) Transcript_8235:3817-4065(+)